MNKKNILLVEDDAIIGMYEKSLLEKEGYNVTHCLSGERALQQIKLDNFDIILMDIDLGKGINGVETAEIILKDNNIPIVFISSHTERDIIEKTESINSYGYIVKNSFETAIFTIIKMAFKLFESNKKIENALKISNEKEKILNSIFNAIPDFIGILDPEFQIIKSNKSLYEFLGLDKNISKGNHYFELFEKEKKEQKESFFEEFINTKGIFKQQIYKKDLNRYFDVMLYPIIEDNGEIINFVEHIRDITEAKKITKAIEEKGEMLSITLQSIGDAVIATDIDCNITLMNKTAEEITGWNFNEAKGKNLLEILKLYDSETMTPIKIPFGLMTSSKERYDLLDNTLLVDKNGNRYIIADSIGVIKDSEENIMGFIIVFSNITERYNLTKQLKTKDAFISSILNSNPNIMLYQILTDINDKERREFIFLTESVKNLYNVTEEEAKKDSSLIYNRVIEEDREKLRAEEEKCLLNNTPLKIEIRLYNPDNSIRWSRIISTPFKISETEVLWNGIEIDITEEKKKYG